MYNIYDELKNIPQLEEINNMEFEVGKAIVQKARDTFKSKELAAHWRISTSTLYSNIYPYYKIKTNENYNKGRISKQEAAVRKEAVAQKDDNGLEKEITNLKQDLSDMKQLLTMLAQSIELNGTAKKFSMTETGSLTGTEIQERLMEVGSALRKDTKYKFTISINEVD